MPYFYLSDNDDLIHPEGDPANHSWMDYSIAQGIDTYQASYYDGAYDSMFFGDPTDGMRGRCFNCQTPEIKDRWAVDVLNCGFEGLSVDAPGASGMSNLIGFRSQGDVYFVMAHSEPAAGYNNPYSNDPYAYCQYSINHLNAIAIGPFEDCPVNRCVGPNEWGTIADIDVNWFVTCACGLLNDISWRTWAEDLISNGPFDSICGYRAAHLRAEQRRLWTYGPIEDGPINYYWDFSNQITTRFGEITDEDLWYQCTSSDPAIIAWMETNCRWIREIHAGRALFDDYADIAVMYAAATNGDSRYVLNEREFSSGFWWWKRTWEEWIIEIDGTR